MSPYTDMDLSKLLNSLEKDMQAAGARLVAAAMSRHDDDPGRETLIRASEAVFVAARKVGKHLSAMRLDDIIL